MKEALHYEKLNKKPNDRSVRCFLCPRQCTVGPGSLGSCRVRKNINGKLFSVAYARPCAVHVDPIEKKPFYHFLPGEQAFSIATVGCNFSCEFCQNWQISKAEADGEEETVAKEPELLPEQAIRLCKKNDCRIISYTYTEPTIFYEYMLDIARLAKKSHIKNTMVSNGYINEQPLRELCEFLDGANIDLKGFTEEYYAKSCKGSLAPVLRTLKVLKEEGVWLEITNLVVPGLNDDMKQIEEMCMWIAKELGKDVPLHFSRFHPDYKLTDAEPTPLATLEKAHDIAKKYLDYVYIGNVTGESNTHCPKCDALLIRRSMMSVLENKLKDGKCPKCRHKISGVWK